MYPLSIVGKKVKIFIQSVHQMGHYQTRKRIMRDATECVCIVYIIYH